MSTPSIQSLIEAYQEIYERRSPEELKARAKQLGDRQTIRKVVGDYNKGRADNRKEDPEKYITKEEYKELGSKARDKGQALVDTAVPRGDYRKWTSQQIQKGKDQLARSDRQFAVSDKHSAERVKAKSAANKTKALTKEEVIGYLMDEGFVNNEVSAEVFIEHMSDEWLDAIIEEYKKLPVGKMVRKAANHGMRAVVSAAGNDDGGFEKSRDRADKMAKVADKHNQKKAQSRARINADIGHSKRRGIANPVINP